MNIPGAGAPSGGASGYDPNDPNVKKLNSLMESCYAKTAMSGVAGFGLGALFGMFMASMAYDTPFHTAAPATSTPATTATAPSGAAASTTQPKPAGPITSAATSSSPIARAAAATANSTVAPIKTALPTGTAAATAAATSSSSASAVAAASAGPSAGAAMLPNPAEPLPLSSLPLRQQIAVGFKDMGARSYSTAKNFAMVGALFSGIECGIEGLRAKNDMGNGVAAGCVTGAILARNGGPQAAAVGCAGFAAFSAAIDAYLRMPKDE